MSWQEWREWLAAYRADPWGEERQDLRTSVLANWALAPYRTDGGRLPEFEYPYYQAEPTIEELYEYMLDVEARLEGRERHEGTQDAAPETAQDAWPTRSPS